MRAALIAVLFSLAAAPLAAEVPVLRVQSSDYATAKAIGEAQRTLPAAIGAMQKSHGRFSPSLSFKVALPTRGPERVEMIWVDQIRRFGTGFKARLAGHPRHLPRRIRDEVHFDYSQIADWAVQAVDGRFYGYYTTRVLRDRASGKLADDIRATLVPRPLPPDWRFNPGGPEPVLPDEDAEAD